jgi:hypothetical protein
MTEELQLGKRAMPPSSLLNCKLLEGILTFRRGLGD